MSAVDVIVPCYRYAEFLSQCVASVLEQAAVDVRVLIIDDCSPDETPDVAAELVRQDDRVSYRRHEVNHGHIRTYNEGIEWASAPYVLLLSADDYLLPGALAKATSLLDAQPRVSFAFGNVVQLEADGRRRKIKPLVLKGLVPTAGVIEGERFIRASGAENIVPTPTAVVRTALQKATGGYRVDLPHTGDMEMWFRLAARGAVGFVDSDLAVYRKHSSNMSVSYAVNNWFPDVRQRRAALDIFFGEAKSLLSDIEATRGEAFYALACETIGFASAAFNDAELELSRELSAYAVEMSPTVQKSWPWRKLTLKRTVGTRAWRAIQSGRRRPSGVGQ